MKMRFNEEHNHAVRYILGFVCVLLLLVFVYYLVLQPIIAKRYLGPEIYEGVHLVQSNEYLAFDGGEDFSEVLETCGAFELGDLTEFFYFDNRRSDSLFYGKQCDVYALSVKVASDALYEEKKSLFIQNTSGPMQTDTFAYYSTAGTDMPGVVFAFQDDTRTIRFVYVTGAHPHDPLVSGIAQNSPLFQYDDK